MITMHKKWTLLLSSLFAGSPVSQFISSVSFFVESSDYTSFQPEEIKSIIQGFYQIAKLERHAAMSSNTPAFDGNREIEEIANSIIVKIRRKKFEPVVMTVTAAETVEPISRHILITKVPPNRTIEIEGSHFSTICEWLRSKKILEPLKSGSEEDLRTLLEERYPPKCTEESTSDSDPETVGCPAGGAKV